MVLPALGETSVPARVRLFLALSISLIIYGLIRGSMPLMPVAPVALGVVIVSEVLIGIMIGMSIRLLVSALHIGGTIIAMQSGLAMANAFDPAQGGQTAIVATFMTLVGVTLVFVMDLHHLMISAMYNSYTLFPIGGELAVGSFAELISTSFAKKSAFSFGSIKNFLSSISE